MKKLIALKMKSCTVFLVLFITLILSFNDKLFCQINSVPKDTIFFEKYEELGMELKSEVKVCPKYSLIHCKKWYKIELTQKLINTKEYRTVKTCKSTFKAYGDASQPINYCYVLIKNKKIAIGKYSRIWPFASMTEIDSNGNKVSKKTMIKSKYIEEYYRFMISN